MNPDQPTTEANAATYNRWQRFVNWLAGGPPDPQKIEAWKKKYPTWYRRYALSLAWVFMACYGMVHPFVIERLNATPELDRMETLQVRILHTREGDPHFDMQWPDGMVQAMEWPVEVMFYRGHRVHYWTKAQRQALVGCQATVQVALMRWTLSERYRVWSLSCPEANFEVGIEQTSKYLNKHATSVTFLLVVLLIGFFPLGVVFFLREKRGVL